MKTNKINTLYKLIDWYSQYKNIYIEKKKVKKIPFHLMLDYQALQKQMDIFQLEALRLANILKQNVNLDLVKGKKTQMEKIIYFFLQDIAVYLLSVVKPIRNVRANPQYRIRTFNLKANLTIVDYLTKYPLFGTKYIDFKH